MPKKIQRRTKLSESTKRKTSKILKKLRAMAGLTKAAAARKARINPGTLHHMEAGRRCHPETFKRLIAKYKAPSEVFALLGRKGAKELGYFSVVGEDRVKVAAKRTVRKGRRMVKKAAKRAVRKIDFRTTYARNLVGLMADQPSLILSVSVDHSTRTIAIHPINSVAEDKAGYKVEVV